MMWNAIKKSLRSALSESEFGLWIKPLECQLQEGNVLELAGPDRFFCAWVEDRYLDLIRRTAQELGQVADIRLQVVEHRPVQFESGKGGQLLLPGTAATPKLRSLHPAFTVSYFLSDGYNCLPISPFKVDPIKLFS